MTKKNIEELTNQELLELYKEITDFLESGRSSVYRFLNTVGYSLYHTSAPESYFQNINDPDTYAKVCKEFHNISS